MGNHGVSLLEDGVEPTNHRAERAHRFAVLWRGMMQGRFNEMRDCWVERVLLLRETHRLRRLPNCPAPVEVLT